METFTHDGIDQMAEVFKPLGVVVTQYIEENVYYLIFELNDLKKIYPAWDRLPALVTPFMGKYKFPNATLIDATPNRVKYRLGTIFEFLQNIQ
jgi:hypothetical protein